LVFRAAPEFRYDPAKGSFRGWLFTIARNEIRKFITRKAHRERGTGDSDMRQILEEQPDVQPDEGEWDREYQLTLFHWAAERVKVDFRDATWQVFWRTVVQNEPVEVVSRELGLTTGAVYIARSRVLTRIKQEIATAHGVES